MNQPELDRLVRRAGEMHGEGKVAEAEGLYRAVLVMAPGRLDAMCGLGLIATQMGRHGEAVGLLKWEVVSRAGNPLLLVALGVSVLAVGGGAERALECAKRAIAIDSGFADARNLLGCGLHATGRLEEAAAAFREAVRLKGDYPEAHYNLGRVFYDAERMEEAVGAYRNALLLRPGYAGAWFNLGFALRKLAGGGELDEAERAFRRAVELQPKFSEAMHNLGVTIAEKGQVREAVVWHRKALEADPGNVAAHSGLMYLLVFDPDCTTEALAAEGKRWDARHASWLRSERVEFANAREPEKRLRVGYVSPDFYAHAQCRFTLPFFAEHDHERFEVHMYSSVRKPDAITEMIRKHADVWHNARGLSDTALAEKIRADGIDVLVDLTMHMSEQRLLMFAQKPAPVQMTWLAYPTCPGVSAIDYRITDSQLEPRELGDGGFPERPIYVDPLNCCYDPVAKTPEVGELPAKGNGYITFGSINNFRKMSPEVMALWAEAMRGVEGSRLKMLCPRGESRVRVVRAFEEMGIEAERIELMDHLRGDAYMEKYLEIDIGLDPFPYNGITTTLDSLWMGVPVLTLWGKTAPSRASAAILRVIGMGEWVCDGWEGFVRRARDFGGDVEGLAQVRVGLRERMRGSAVMDGRGFARRMEGAYRQAWSTWCLRSQDEDLRVAK